MAVGYFLKADFIFIISPLSLDSNSNEQILAHLRFDRLEQNLSLRSQWQQKATHRQRERCKIYECHKTLRERTQDI